MLLKSYLNRVVVGDCIEMMNKLPAESVDLIFADPHIIFNLMENLKDLIKLKLMVLKRVGINSNLFLIMIIILRNG